METSTMFFQVFSIIPVLYFIILAVILVLIVRILLKGIQLIELLIAKERRNLGNSSYDESKFH